MQLGDILSVLEDIAPTRHAAEWDNVGLLVGDPSAAVTRILLTIDYTPDVAAEAAREGCDLVVAYHPPIFRPLKAVRAGSPVFAALRAGIAIYSPHTALDAADGGTNDVLGDALGLIARAPLRFSDDRGGDSQYKLVFFVPREAADAVSAAVFGAGAGRIGQYSSCSFRSPGEGTFFGEAGTNPAVGESGKLERVPELRVEMVLPRDRVNAALAALRAAHPYEEPAFDLVRLAREPSRVGMGRVGPIAPTDLATVVTRVKDALSLGHVLLGGSPTAKVERAAVCAGSGGELLDDALAMGVDLYLTGELRHHDVLRARAKGVAVICALHSASERAVLARLKPRIEAAAPGVGVRVSTADHEPLALA